jgi:hypothetical protein
MQRIRPFRDMVSAPQDGRIVEVCDGVHGKIVLAYWHHRQQGWVDDNDHRLTRQALPYLLGWRPVD